MNKQCIKFKLALRQLRRDTKRECKTVRSIFDKEIKTLAIISIFTFFLILSSLIDAPWNFQTIILEFSDKIFSWNIALSIFLTGLSTSIYKFCKNQNKDKLDREKYYWVSLTFLDRVAAIFLGALGIGIANFIFILIFYCWLDDGKFKNSISIPKLFLIFLILTVFFFGMNIIFKYFSGEVKTARESGKTNDYVPVVFAILYTIFFVIPIPLIKYL